MFVCVCVCVCDQLSRFQTSGRSPRSFVKMLEVHGMFIFQGRKEPPGHAIGPDASPRPRFRTEIVCARNSAKISISPPTLDSDSYLPIAVRNTTQSASPFTAKPCKPSLTLIWNSIWDSQRRKSKSTYNTFPPTPPVFTAPHLFLSNINLCTHQPLSHLQ